MGEGEGVGSGKVLKQGFKLWMSVTQQHYMSKHCPLGYRRWHHCVFRTTCHANVFILAIHRLGAVSPSGRHEFESRLVDLSRPPPPPPPPTLRLHFLSLLYCPIKIKAKTPKINLKKKIIKGLYLMILTFLLRIWRHRHRQIMLGLFLKKK